MEILEKTLKIILMLIKMSSFAGEVEDTTEIC